MKTYIVKHRDEAVRAASRSGGMFTALSDWVLDNGGVVYGARMDNCSMTVVHDRAETKDKRDTFRGSKYLRSRVNDCYRLAREDLKSGRRVLFSGTPCQIAALKKSCSDIDNALLISVDIACHGAPDETVWRKFLEYMENKHHGKVQAVDFRNKRKYGWASHIETVTINGKEYDSRKYTDLFFRHLILPKGCFSCPYKSLDRQGDITLADAWGGTTETEKVFNDNKGVSLVLVNSEKGAVLFEKVLDDIIYHSCNMDSYMQPAFCKNYSIPGDYEQFRADAEIMGFERLYKKYCKVSMLKRVMRELRFIIKRVKKG